MIDGIEIVEIGPRDGFQNVKQFIPTQLKKQIVEGIISAGLQRIQLTSFVSPKAIPQMKDALEISRYFIDKYDEVLFSALVPNLKGAEIAMSCGYKEITPVISLSELHNLKNVRKTHAESLSEIERIRGEFPDIHIVQDIATVFGCPYGGRQSIDELISLIERLVSFGIDEFTLCDTIGVAYPALVNRVISEFKSNFSNCRLNIHIHDTRNMGVLNSFSAIKSSVDAIQTSLGGLGGCPFAPGASGNTSTEDLVYLLNQEGIHTGIDFRKLLMTAELLHQNVQGQYSGHHLHIKAKQKDFND